MRDFPMPSHHAEVRFMERQILPEDIEVTLQKGRRIHQSDCIRYEYGIPREGKVVLIVSCDNGTIITGWKTVRPKHKKPRTFYISQSDRASDRYFYSPDFSSDSWDIQGFH